jgi:hypothetical protein
MTSEQQGLKEKQHQIDEATQTPAETPKMNYTPAPSDYVHPGMKYGDKPGEQRLPVYDDGGDVPEDQVAKLGQGERVLNPQEAAAYRQAEQEYNVAPGEMKQEGMMVDVGGAKAIPNPKGIKPMMDTEPPEQHVAPLQGATMHMENAPIGKSVMNTEKAPLQGADTVTPRQETPMQEISTMGTPRMRIETPMSSGTTDHPEAPQQGEEAAAPTEVPRFSVDKSFGALGEKMDKQKQIEDDLKVVEQDKLAAMQSGDLTKLGMANIHERQLKAALPELPQPTPPTARENVMNQEKDFRNKMINAPSEQERFQAEKDLAEMQRRTPWGTEGSAHPGVLGKIGHVLGGIGQAAAMGTVPYALPMIPGTQANIAKHEAVGEQGVEQAQKKEATAAETGLKEAQTRMVGMGTTVPEKVYNWAMKGNAGQPMINPDTQKPYTPPEAQTLSTGEGKNVAEQLARALIHKVNPETGQNYTPDEALIEAMKQQSGAKMNEHQKRVADYVSAHNMEDTPANRETARIALESADTAAKQIAALPYAEQKTKFSSDLATTRALLVQQNADANGRGLEADKLQNTENARYNKVNSMIQMGLNAVNTSDHSEFAASIAPVATLFAATNEAGIKRVNAVELAKFMPANGSLLRWAETHADKWTAGDIPDEYRKEVKEFLTNMGKQEEITHTANSKSIDDTVRSGGQEPVQKPAGGAEATPKKSESKAPPTAPPVGSGFAAWKAQQSK